jgi:hypothetical protein
MRLSRRSALGACASVIVGWLWAGVMRKPQGARASDPGSTTADGRHGALGRAYLRRYPEEASQSRLAGLVPADPVARTRQVRADFATGQVVILDGWVLSRTECRYCALHALSGAGRG